MLFSAFSPLNGGAIGTYGYPTESPYKDLDAGLDYTRMKTADAFYPFPVVTGYIDGYTPLLDNLEYSLMMGKNTFGPFVGDLSAPLQMIFPNIQGGLAKVKG